MLFIKKIIRFVISKKILSYPPKKKIVIYDSHSKEIIKKFSLKNFIILDTRYEKFYLPILFKNFLRFRFSYNHYMQEFIHYVNPNLLITIIDQDINFYKLKLKSGKKITIQQSRRSELPEDDLFNFNKEKKRVHLKSDFIFAQNKFIGKKYSSIIDGKIDFLGSFRSNSINLSFKKKNIKILYISTYRKSVDQRAKEKNLFQFEYLKNEYKLLNTIKKYSRNNKIKITILGSSIEYPNEEKLFFSKYFKKNFHFLKRSSKRNTYQIIDKSKVVLGIDSTLIYESFGRGVKSLFFCVRDSSLFDFSSRKFSWPLKLKKEGAFWLNYYSEKKIFNKIDNIKKMNNKKWLEISKNYREKIMPYYKNNQKVNKTIHEILKN